MNTNQPTNQPTNPPNPDVILKRFRQKPENSDESSTSVLSGDDWLKIESLIRRSVRDQSSKEVRKLRRSLHHISVQNSVLHHEIKGLKDAILTKKRHKKKSFTLQFLEDDEYHGGALVLSPRKIERARIRERERLRQKDELQLQKEQRSQLKEQARLYKLQQAQGRRVERERLKIVKEREKAEKAAEKERQKAARDAQKAIQLSQNGKRKASGSSTQKQKRQKRMVAAAAAEQSSGAAPAALLRTTRRGRNITLPSKYK